MQRFIDFLRNSKGATAIEYAMLAGLIAVALVATFTTYKGKVNTLFNNVGTNVSTSA